MMVRWYHAIFSAYGFWLPNDPRGSWYDFVGSYELYRHGTATTVATKQSLAHEPHDSRRRISAKQALKYPPVRFTDRHRDYIAAGVERACHEASFELLALAIGFDHAHAIVGRHERTIEQVVQHFKSRATQQMNRAGCHPLAAYRDQQGTMPTPWSEGCWSVFINDEHQLTAAIDYVCRHPMKEGLPPQNWSFVKPSPV